MSIPIPFPFPDISSGLLVWLKYYFSLPSPPRLLPLSTPKHLRFPGEMASCKKQSRANPDLVCSRGSWVKSQASVFSSVTWGDPRHSGSARHDFRFALLQQVADLRTWHPQLCPGENGLDLLSPPRAGTLFELLLGGSPLSRRLRVQNGRKGAEMSPGQWRAILEAVGRAGLEPRVFLSGNPKGPWCPQRDGTLPQISLCPGLLRTKEHRAVLLLCQR